MTPSVVPARACMAISRQASAPCSRNSVYSVQLDCTTYSHAGSSRSGISELKLQPLPAPWWSMTRISSAPAALAADGGVDLLGIEAAALLVHLLAAGDLLPLDDPGDTLHVADDLDAHQRVLPDRAQGHARSATRSVGLRRGDGPRGQSAFSSPAAPAGSARRARGPSWPRAPTSSSTTTAGASGPRRSAARRWCRPT